MISNEPFAGYYCCMPYRTAPWDGREPITDALVRRGMRDAFQAAVDQGNRAEAVQVLCDVGADEETAWQMIDVLLPAEDEPPVA
jgi:hypothetical protein